MSNHYSSLTPQPIQVIEGWGLSFHLGNVVKYIARAPIKGDRVRDLRKAIWYLNREVQILEAAGGPIPTPDPQA